MKCPLVSFRTFGRKWPWRGNQHGSTPGGSGRRRSGTSALRRGTSAAQQGRRQRQLSSILSASTAGRSSTTSAGRVVPKPNIDHVAVGPGGVFVIDSKNWSGRIAVKDSVLLQNGHRREQAVIGAAEAALALTQLLGQVPVTGVLCFVRDEPINGWARDVMVCSTSTLSSILISRPPTLHPAAVQRFARRLEGALRSASAPLPVRPARQQAPLIARAPRRGPRPRRRSRGNSPLRALAGLVLVLGLLTVGAPLAQRLAGSVAAGVTRAIVPPPQTIGSAITVPGTSGRPELRATASRIADARPVRGREHVVPRGQKLIAVDVRVENQGDRPWSLASPGTSWIVRDGAGVAHSPLGLRGVNLGQALPASMAVPARGQVHGWLVFAIPTKQSAAEVQLSVGPGLPGEARWRVQPRG